MALVQALVKSSTEFVYGDDFALFYERFNAFISGAKCEPSSVFSLLLSYLDDASFKKVKALTFSDDHKTDDHIDISKKLTYDFIKEVLTHDKVPVQIQLRYRIQGKMKLRLNLVKLLERSEIMRTEMDANKIRQS